MRTILPLGLGLAILGSAALAQSPRPATSRIVDVAPPLNPVPQYQPPAVDRFDRQRALQERGDSQSNHQQYPVQSASNLQPVSPPRPVPQATATPPQSAAALPAMSEAVPKPPAPRHWRRLLIAEQCASARDMYPHYAYQAPYGGAYYFRPYMAEHIGRQAEIAGGWSGDRSNPYDNRFLQAIYGPGGD